MNTEKDNSSVQVAVRIRPLVESEKNRGCCNVLEVYPQIQQIRIKDSDKAFSYNYVFDSDSTQEAVYNNCVKEMINNLFKGYNMTILAYGQTGSGKTYSMGTAHGNDQDPGIISRAINDIFNYVCDNFAYDFTISVSFMELYQEILYDLLSSKPKDQCTVEIRDDGKQILIPGLTEEPVKTAMKALEFLMKGTQSRAVSSTNMNSHSSRSHAVFTINICMQKKDDSNLNKSAKFHLVDLAGSERCKKTGATGSTLREAVSINKGLLVLGNVISALAEDRPGYICYRDSNLTRLLKDSLGGNSITLMLACVSPADYNLEETVNTLRYADRARKIKNKPIVNQDPKAAEINRLNKIVQQLRMELIGQGGPIICQAELNQLKTENSSLKTRVKELIMQLSTSLNENTSLVERLMILQSANECMSAKLMELKDQYNLTLNNLNTSIDKNDSVGIKQHVGKLQCIQELFTTIDTERQRTDNEIRKHERSASTSNTVNSELVLESEFSEKQEHHTKQQIAMNSELQQITKMLAMKEHLAEQIMANTCHVNEYTSIDLSEERVTALEKEKEELLQHLKEVQTKGGNSKIAEQRRQRVQELEKEILELRRKITEQARLIKLKEKDKQRILQLNNEIQQMKSAKVKLIKNMKQESEKFRTWKLQRERELLNLKEQNRKKQHQIVKMETMHSRQQNVLKRKMEEIAAVNKRLKDALAVRKNVHDQKHGKFEKVGAWVQQELEIYTSIIVAEATINSLLEDRAVLTQNLEELRNDPELTNPDLIKQIEDDIELQSNQIADLQQKMLDSDHENRDRTRWDNIQTMAEAKQVFKTLFETVANIKKNDILKDNKISELESVHGECGRRLACFENDLKQIESNHQQNLSELANKYEEQISVLLRQLRGVKVEGVEDDLQERYEIQQQALETAEQQIEKLKEQNAELQKKMEEINCLIQQSHLRTPQPVKKLRKKKTEYRTEDIGANSSNDSFSDNIEADPDWRNTPLAKHVQKLRDESVLAPPKERLTVKRNSDGSCNCKGNCSRRTCGCKKTSNACTSLCKCNKSICANNNEKENVHEDSLKSTTDEDDSFKIPRLTRNLPVLKKQSLFKA